MSYENQFNDAVTSGEAKDISYEIIQFTDEGTIIVGKILGFEDFKSTKFDQECLQWLIDTDEGPVSCVVGANADSRLIGGGAAVGDLVRIEYKGKKPLGDGRSVNLFNIKLVKG